MQSFPLSIHYISILYTVMLECITNSEQSDQVPSTILISFSLQATSTLPVSVIFLRVNVHQYKVLLSLVFDMHHLFLPSLTIFVMLLKHD